MVLARLTDEAMAALQGSPAGAQLEADPRDRVLLESILRELDAQLTVKYNLECWGGVIAKSSDERVVVLNTLESRLEQATPYLHRHLAAWFESNDRERLRLW
jgi:vacuolar-type H+-ATPase subunit E/Vma4